MLKPSEAEFITGRRVHRPRRYIARRGRPQALCIFPMLVWSLGLSAASHHETLEGSAPMRIQDFSCSGFRHTAACNHHALEATATDTAPSGPGSLKRRQGALVGTMLDHKILLLQHEPRQERDTDREAFHPQGSCCMVRTLQRCHQSADIWSAFLPGGISATNLPWGQKQKGVHCLLKDGNNKAICINASAAKFAGRGNGRCRGVPKTPDVEPAPNYAMVAPQEWLRALMGIMRNQPHGSWTQPVYHDAHSKLRIDAQVSIHFPFDGNFCPVCLSHDFIHDHGPPPFAKPCIHPCFCIFWARIMLIGVRSGDFAAPQHLFISVRYWSFACIDAISCTIAVSQHFCNTLWPLERRHQRPATGAC